jgi:hypothetical protein
VNLPVFAITEKGGGVFAFAINAQNGNLALLES